MQPIPSRFIVLIALVGILLVVLAINITTSSSFQSNINTIPPTLEKTVFTSTPTRPAYCVPLPYSSRNNFTRTPTPDRVLGTVPPTGLSPSVTPIVFTNTYDLDPSISQEDKSAVLVFRCNGSWDFYWLGPSRTFQSIPLSPGDYIWQVAPPASIMGKEPPRITSTVITPTVITPTTITTTAYPSTPVVTFTSVPYPPPATEYPTVEPYPAPETATPEAIP